MRRIRRHLRRALVAATLAGGLVIGASAAHAFTINGDPSGWDYHGSFKDAICDFFGFPGLCDGW